MHELNVGGAERVISNLVNHMNRDKFEVHLCLFKKKGALVETINDDVIIHDLQATRVLSSVHKLWGLILKVKPNIVFSSITHVNLLLSFSAPVLRFILKDTIFVTREVNNPSIRARYMPKSKSLDRFYKYFIGNFDHIIAQSNYMKEDLIGHYGLSDKKITVVNNPLNSTEILSKLSEEKEKNLLMDNKINIIAIGNLRRQKGFDKLLEVMNYMDNRFHLNIVGEGIERHNLEAKIAALELQDSISLLGFQSNPYLFMKEADIVVLSSNYEGFPNVILEANVCSKFVVAYNCPGVSDEIIQNGVNGILVEYGNVELLARALIKYASVSHDEQAIIASTKKYNVKNIVKKYEEIFIK